MSSKRNSVGLPESVAFAPAAGQLYRYRAGMGMMGSAEWCQRMDDFVSAPIATNVPVGWAATIIDTGATLIVSTTAGSLGATGCLLAASDGTDEGTGTYGDKVIQLTAAKRFFMEMRAQTSLAATTDLQFGLTSVTATTNPEDLWTTTATDLIAFGVLNGSAYPQMLADLSNSGSTAETGTVAISDATWTTMSIYWDGYQLQGYVDGQFSLQWSQTVATTVPVGVALAPFFGFRTGTAAGNIGTFDYIRWAIER